MAKKNAPAKEAKKAKAEKDPQKEAKRKARMEALKNRPAGQRPNSRQVDVIDLEKGKVMNFGYPVRKKGTLVTSVGLDEKGNPVSSSVTFIPGVKVKAKKGHGTIIPGVAGMGKGQDAEVEDAGEGEDDGAED